MYSYSRTSPRYSRCYCCIALYTLLVIAIVLCVFTIGDAMLSDTFGADWYVDGLNGSDTNSGTQAQPVQTIAKGLHLPQPGDTLHIEPTTVYTAASGVVPGYFALSGTATGTITIQGDTLNGNKPQIVGINALGVEVAPGSSYLRITNLDVTTQGSAAYSMTDESCFYVFDGANHIEIDHNNAHDCGDNGIASRGADYLTVDHNNVWNNAQDTQSFCDSGIELYQFRNVDTLVPTSTSGPSGYHNLVEFNRVYSNTNYLYGGAGGCPVTTTTNGTTTTVRQDTDGNGIIIDDSRNTQNPATPTLTSAAGVGATMLNVSSTTNIAIGQRLALTPGVYVQGTTGAGVTGPVTVTAIGTGTVTLSSNLLTALPSGTTMLFGPSAAGAYRSSTLMMGNVVYGNGGHGLYCFYSDHCTFVNNTAYLNNQDPVLQAYAAGEIECLYSGDCNVRSNIAVSDGKSVSGGHYAVTFWACSGLPVIAAKNVLWVTTGAIANAYYTPTYRYDTVHGNSNLFAVGYSMGGANRFADPLLVNPAGAMGFVDLHIHGSVAGTPSPAAGFSDPSFAETYDLDGTYVSTVANAGAYQSTEP